jgi:hypothetical protein
MDVTITAPNGRSLTISGNRIPTEADIRDIFAKAGIDTSAPPVDLSKMPSMQPMPSHGPSAPATPPRSIFGRLADAITDAHGRQAAVLAHPEVVQGQAAVLPELTAGAAMGGASTIYHGGDLIRRGVNYVHDQLVPPTMSELITGREPVMPRVINTPEVQAAITPRTPLQKIGFGAEQGAEFGVPLTKISGAVKGAPLLVRAGTEALASAGVAGLQSGGDTGQMATAAALGLAGPVAGAALAGAGRAAQRAAAGAADGGIGGAIASVVRDVAPAKPRMLALQGLKPRNVRVNFEAALDRALPEVKASEAAIGKPIDSLDDFLTAVKDAKRRVWSQYEQLAGPARAIGSTIDGTPIADEIVQSIPKKLRLENPEAAARLEGLANAYRRRFSLQDAEELLTDANAELDTFYAQFPGGQRSTLRKNPAIAHTVATAEKLRDLIYGVLDGPGEGAAARELKRRYGALLEVEDAGMRRSMVAKRQQPESLSEQIGTVRAAADLARGVWRLGHGDLTGAADIAAARAGRATAKYLKEQQTTDALIRRAMASFEGAPEAVTMPAPREIRGLLPRGPLITPPPADVSGGRGVSAWRDVQYSGAPKQLPVGRPPIVTPPPADTSFVRSVPGEYARHDVRGLLPEGQAPPPPQRVFHLPGEVAPDTAGGRLVPAAPIDYAIDPTVAVKAGGVRVKQFSGDPNAAAAAIANDDVRAMLRRMRDDLDVFKPQRGRLTRALNAGEEDSFYTHGTPGSPVGDDVRVISEQHVGNDEIVQAINDLLAGKMPKNRLHTAALDAAVGYLEQRPGYRGPSVPEGLNETVDAPGTIDVTPVEPPQSSSALQAPESLRRRAKSLRALADREDSPRKARAYLNQAKEMERRAAAVEKKR